MTRSTSGSTEVDGVLAVEVGMDVDEDVAGGEVIGGAVGEDEELVSCKYAFGGVASEEADVDGVLLVAVSG